MVWFGFGIFSNPKEMLKFFLNCQDITFQYLLMQILGFSFEDGFHVKFYCKLKKIKAKLETKYCDWTEPKFYSVFQFGNKIKVSAFCP